MAATPAAAEQQVQTQSQSKSRVSGLRLRLRLRQRHTETALHLQLPTPWPPSPPPPLEALSLAQPRSMLARAGPSRAESAGALLVFFGANLSRAWALVMTGFSNSTPSPNPSQAQPIPANRRRIVSNPSHTFVRNLYILLINLLILGQSGKSRLRAPPSPSITPSSRPHGSPHLSSGPHVSLVVGVGAWGWRSPKSELRDLAVDLPRIADTLWRRRGRKKCKVQWKT